MYPIPSLYELAFVVTGGIVVNTVTNAKIKYNNRFLKFTFTLIFIPPIVWDISDYQSIYYIEYTDIKKKYTCYITTK